jgi:putative endonuclease
VFSWRRRISTTASERLFARKALAQSDIKVYIMSKEYYFYIMTNKSRTLYTGVTGDLMRRVYEHKNKLIKGFTSRYNIQYLVYYETASSIDSAIEREKQIKGWLRAKKISLIDSINSEWKDLSEEWFVK